jgi:hypothetical protein
LLIIPHVWKLHFLARQVEEHGSRHNFAAAKLKAWSTPMQGHFSDIRPNAPPKLRRLRLSNGPVAGTEFPMANTPSV